MPNQPKTPGHTVRIPDEEWLPAKLVADQKGETMTDVIRRALRQYVATAVLFAMLLVGGMAGGMREGEVTLFGGGTCKSLATCEANADNGPAIEAMLAEQVATFGATCVDPAKFVGIPARVLVRNARMTDGDTGVVRAVDLDAALAGARSGKVYVLKACA